MGGWIGRRWNEALGVRLCDLNPLRHELTLGRVMVNQNGSRTFTERFSRTEDARTVPVPVLGMEALLEHVERYCAGAGRGDFLFLTRNGNRPLWSSFSRDVLRPAVARAGQVATSPGPRCGTPPRR